MTTEIATRADRITTEWLMERGAQGTDLTLIYHTHGTPEHAAESTAYIEPDSVVFLEGYSIIPSGQANYEPNLMTLKRHRLEQGKDSEAYQQYKQALLDHITANDYRPTGPTDFTLHNLAVLTDLIQKDCVIHYADHKDIRGTSLDEQTSSEYNSLFRETEKYICETALPDIPATAGIAGAIKAVADSTRDELVAHGMREGYAAVELLLRMGDIQNKDMAGSLQRTPDGKISTYVMYGTAHAKSLTWQFTSRGMEPKVIEVKSLEEHEYIDAIFNPDYNNLRRRVGHTAIRSLSFKLLSFDSAQELIRDSYGSLDYLNEAEKGELKKFLITCALAMRESNRDEDAAFKQYLSILRSFMPNPQEFIPE